MSKLVKLGVCQDCHGDPLLTEGCEECGGTGRATCVLGTDEVRRRLRDRYAAPEWALMEEVASGTGYLRKTTYSDALAFNLWPSRGLTLHGFEIKVSRSDWRRELDDPSKSSIMQSFCDRWWLVVGDSNIVQPGELPAAWGLLVPKGKGLKVAVDAPELEKPRKEWDRAFVAALVRRCSEGHVPEDIVGELARARVQEAEERFTARVEGERKTWESRMQTLENIIHNFEQASGVDIRRSWELGRIGEAVRCLLAGNPSYAAVLDGVAQRAEDVARQAREHAAALRLVEKHKGTAL